MKESFIWIFLFGVLSVYPFFPLRHVPIMDRLKIPFWKLMLYATLIMIIQGFSYLWLANLYPFASPILAWHRKLFMIPYVFLTLLFAKDPCSKTLFMDFFMVGIVMSTIDGAYILERTWFNEAFTFAPHRTDVLIRSTLILLMYPTLNYLFKKELRPVMQIESFKVWRYMTAIPLVFAIISIITTMEAFNHEISIVIFLIRLSVIVGSVLVSSLLAKVLKQLEQAVILEEKSKQSEVLLTLQGEQYEVLAKSIEQTKAARHDLRHQLAAMSNMLDNKEYSQLQEFVDSYRRSISIDQTLILCESYAANSVISYYIALARDENINEIDVRCVLDQNNGIEDVDLCIVLGNLLENAIEGCLTLPKDKRKIKLRISPHAGNLMLIVDNTFDGYLLMEKDELLSRKRQKKQKGVGLASVTSVAKKYNGEVQFEQNNEWFMVSVRLTI